MGKPFPTVLPYAREIYCAKDTATALAMAGPYLAEKYRTYASWGQDEVLPGDDTFNQPFAALLRDRFVLGSPEECYEQLRPCWEEAGANFLIFRTHWSGMPVGHALASMRLINAPDQRRALAGIATDRPRPREQVSPGPSFPPTRRHAAKHLAPLAGRGCIALLFAGMTAGLGSIRAIRSARRTTVRQTPVTLAFLPFCC